MRVTCGRGAANPAQTDRLQEARALLCSHPHLTQRALRSLNPLELDNTPTVATIDTSWFVPIDGPPSPAGSFM